MLCYRMPQVLNHWQEGFLKRQPETFTVQPSRGDAQELMTDLEHMLGWRTIELEVARTVFDLKGLAWLVADGDMLKMRQMLRNAGAQLGDTDRLVPREVVVDLATGSG